MMDGRPEPRRRQRGAAPRNVAPAGFTLLELILAMAIAVSVATALFACLHVAFKAKRSADRVVEPSRTAEMAMDFLRDDLESAAPPSGILAGTFIGNTSQDDRGRRNDDLVFYSATSGPSHTAGDGDLKKVELTVIVPDGSTDHVLVRRVTSNLLSPEVIDPDDEVLCRGVAGFSLRYYDGVDWYDTYDSTTQSNSLPMAVEVTLELDRPDATGTLQTVRFTRVFQMSCVTPSGTTSDSSSGTTSSSTTGGN